MKKLFVIILAMTLIFTSCIVQEDSAEENATENQEETSEEALPENSAVIERPNRPEGNGPGGPGAEGAGREGDNRPHGPQGDTLSENDENTQQEENQNQNAGNGLVGTYPIVDSGQTDYYSDSRQITEPSEGDDFYGQDANYEGSQPSYTDNGDGTVTDNVTGLMWQQTMDDKMTFTDAFDYAENSDLAGYNDWRLPTIKELWSLMMYYGSSSGTTADELYINTDYFDQPIGDTSAGEREIDAQVWSSTEYTGLTMINGHTVFGVNFIDGRIKGYGTGDPRQGGDKKMYVRLVRGNTDYGINNFVENDDGTISDLATGLMWQQADDGQTRNWEDSLSYAEGLEYAGYDDWRLPNAKELQSIIDYTNSMQENGKAAISDLFNLTEITDTKGEDNYGFYWTSTTHLDGRNIYDSAAYVCFGEALGEMNGTIMDVHGAGALRSDPKSGDEEDYPQYRGPQGDIVYVYNFCLLVRDIQ